MGNVDADPLPVQLLRRMNGRAAPAERIEDDIAGVGGSGDDAFEECDGFLGGVAEAFFADLG